MFFRACFFWNPWSIHPFFWNHLRKHDSRIFLLFLQSLGPGFFLSTATKTFIFQADAWSDKHIASGTVAPCLLAFDIIRVITLPKFTGIFSMQKTLSLIKSLLCHSIIWSSRVVGSKRGQQPVGVISVIMCRFSEIN